MGLITDLKESLTFAAAHLSGAVRRSFMAKTVEALGPGGQRQAAREFGWDRDTIRKGAVEMRTGGSGAEANGDYRRANGARYSIDLRLPKLRQDMFAIVQPQLQTDPKFTSTRLYCRLSVAQVVKALIDTKGYRSDEMPCDESIRKILIEMGCHLRKVRKCKPLKKVPEAEQIFETVRDLNRQADACEDDEILRISQDAKARVKVGEFSRGGYSRADRDALDHDFAPDAVLIPVGIFLPKYNEVYIDLYNKRAPADAWVDSLEAFWQREGHRFSKTKQLLLNFDNGPENNSYRTQFLARMVGFANRTGLILTLAYYPPYQSKYNAVERCWGVLENHWSGELLDSVEAVVGFASTMTYNGVKAVVRVVTKAYDNGVRLSKKAMREVNKQVLRPDQIPKYLVTIVPACNS
jgi:hypothetical protein